MFETQVKDKTYRVMFQHTAAGTHCFVKEVHKDKVETVATGVAVIAPHDTPNKSIGRKVSMARALKKAHIPRNQRSEFWTQYFQKSPIKGKNHAEG